MRSGRRPSTNETDGTYYRVPTKDEMYLAFPRRNEPCPFRRSDGRTSEITETLPEKLFGSKETNGGEGKSWFKKNAAAVTSPGRPAGLSDRLCHPFQRYGAVRGLPL